MRELPQKRYIEQFVRLATHFSEETGSRREMVLVTIDLWLDAWNEHSKSA